MCDSGISAVPHRRKVLFDGLHSDVERQAVLAMVRAFAELNTIRARDGVPYMHTGFPASVDVDYFSSVVDGLDEAVKAITGESAHLHPWLYETG